MIFPGALGDLICFLPALAEIGKRAAVTPLLLCKGSLSSLIRAAGLAEPRPIETRPVSWLFSASPPGEAAEYFAAFSSVDSFTGFGDPIVEENLKRWAGPRGRVHPFRPSGAVHLARHFLDCIGVPTGDSVDCRLSLPTAVLDHGRRRFPSLLNRQSLLVVHPGSGGVSKRWSRAGFVEIADLWAREHGAALIVLGPAEEGERSFWETRRRPVAADLEIVELGALLVLCDAYLGNDSGVSHLAGAVGARGAVIFGPSDPQCWRPLSSRLRVIQPEPWTALGGTPTRAEIQTVKRELRDAAATSSP